MHLACRQDMATCQQDLQCIFIYCKTLFYSRGLYFSVNSREHRDTKIKWPVVAENLQKECLCYFIISSTSLWRNQFNHIMIYVGE